MSLNTTRVLVFKPNEGHEKATGFFTPANASSYDIVVKIATFGRDRFWKDRIIDIITTKLAGTEVQLGSLSDRQSLRHGIYLDLASGTGILSRMMERELDKNLGPKDVVCLDLAYHYLRIAKKKCLGALQTNGTAELLPYRAESFDSITSSYMSKYVNMDAVVKECWRVLKSGGVVVFHDFTYPSNRTVRRLWNFYFILLRFIFAEVTPWKQVFQDLDNVIKSSDWINETFQALRVSGFRNIVIKFYTMQTSAIVIGQKP